MVKNYRKIPNHILEKISTLKSEEIVVWSVLKISELEINKDQYEKLWITIDEWNLSFNKSIIPSVENWRFSKKNIEWDKIKHPERPKISHTYYAWEKKAYWKNRYFSQYITRDVIAFDIIPPKELSLGLELLEENKVNNETYYTFKLSITDILNKSDDDFNDKLLFNINLLQENIWFSDIFLIGSNKQEYLDSLVVDWNIFPPGTRESDLNKIIWKNNNLSANKLSDITDRYDFIRNLNPSYCIIWKSWMRNYFWAKFSDNLVVFENKDYWNALYILFDDWEELSQLSRTEIQSRPADKYIRIPHTWDWKTEAKKIINNRR
jgi:hypothetical protein